MSEPEALSVVEQLGGPEELFDIHGIDGSVGTVFRGIFSEHIDQLIAHSASDPDLIWETPSDFSSRFATRKSTIDHAGRRQYYTLLTEYGELGGLIWFGKDDWHQQTMGDEQSPSHDLAIRTYGPGRGKGFAGPFIDSVTAQFLYDTESSGLWLEVNSDNDPEFNLYQKAGWIVVGNRGKRDAVGTPRGRNIMQFDIEADQNSHPQSLVVEPVPVYRDYEAAA